MGELGDSELLSLLHHLFETQQTAALATQERGQPYLSLMAFAATADLKNLFVKLGRVEVVHKQKVYERYRALVPGAPDMAEFEAGMTAEIMEGGFRLNDFLAANEPWLKTVRQVLELGMMLETQALDLYLRFAEKSQEAGTKQVLFTLADEEKVHIKTLARLLDEKR